MHKPFILILGIVAVLIVSGCVQERTPEKRYYIQILDTSCEEGGIAAFLLKNEGDHAINLNQMQVKDIVTGDLTDGIWLDSDGNRIIEAGVNQEFYYRIDCGEEYLCYLSFHIGGRQLGMSDVKCEFCIDPQPGEITEWHDLKKDGTPSNDTGCDLLFSNDSVDFGTISFPFVPSDCDRVLILKNVGDANCTLKRIDGGGGITSHSSILHSSIPPQDTFELELSIKGISAGEINSPAQLIDMSGVMTIYSNDPHDIIEIPYIGAINKTEDFHSEFLKKCNTTLEIESAYYDPEAQEFYISIKNEGVVAVPGVYIYVMDEIPLLQKTWKYTKELPANSITEITVPEIKKGVGRVRIEAAECYTLTDSMDLPTSE